MTDRPRWSAVSLLAGALVIAVAALFHPALTGDGPAQLARIAATRGWAAVHWAFLTGFVLVVGGLAGLDHAHGATPGARAAHAGALVSAFGYAVFAMGVLFMLAGAATLADAYARGAPGLASTHAVFVYDMLHPAAQAALRAGAIGVALGLCAWGRALARGGVLPRWLGWGADAGCVAGVAGAALAPSDHPAMILGVAVATLWQGVAGLAALRAGRAGTAT
jgi:hypothetical protein